MFTRRYRGFCKPSSLSCFLGGRMSHLCFLPTFPHSHLSAWYLEEVLWYWNMVLHWYKKYYGQPIFENFIHGTIKRNTSHHQIEPSPTPISQILCVAFLRNNCKDQVLREVLPEVPQDFPSRMPPLTFTHSRHQPSGKM